MQTFRQESIAILRVGGPVIVAQLLQISMNFVDTMMAGRLSSGDLAAVAVGGSVWMPMFLLCLGILMAVNPIVAQCFGAGQLLEIGRHVRQALWLSLGVGVCAWVLIYNAPLVLDRLGIDPQIIPTTSGYVRAVSWGVPALCATVVLRCYSEGVSQTQPMMWISVVGLCGNIVGNYVLMYGKLGMPRLGAVGCGWATAAVTWMMFSCLLGWTMWHRYYRQFGVWTHFEWPDFAELWRTIQLGLPIGISLFMEGGVFAAVALLLSSLGTDVVAGHQIALNVASFTFMVPLGVSMALTIRVGQAVGAGNLAQAQRSGIVGALLACGFMTCAALGMWIFPDHIASLYTTDANVRAVAVSLLQMAAIFQICDGLQVAGAGALRGIKDTRITMIITLFAYWCVGLPLGYTLGITMKLGAPAVWIGLIVGLTIASILLNVRFHFVIRSRMREEAALQFTPTPSLTKSPASDAAPDKSAPMSLEPGA